MSDNNEKNKENNIGCIIAIVIFIVANLIYTFYTTEFAEFENIGKFILTLGGLAIGYFLYKAIKSKFNNSDSEDRKGTSIWGCLIIGLVLLVTTALIINAFTSSPTVNYVIGVLVIVVLSIILGVYMYNSSNR